MLSIRLFRGMAVAVLTAALLSGCAQKEHDQGNGPAATPPLPTAPSSYASGDGGMTYSRHIAGKPCPNSATTGALAIAADGTAVLTVRATGDVVLLGTGCAVQGTEVTEVVVNGKIVPGIDGSSIAWADCYGRKTAASTPAGNTLRSTGKTSAFGSLQFLARVSASCTESDGTVSSSVEGTLSQVLPK